MGATTGPAPGANLTGTANMAEASDKPHAPMELRPAAVFSHRMVLQRRRPIPVFGTGEPGRTVMVTLASSERSGMLALCGDGRSDSVVASGTVGDDGNWLVELPPLEAGDGYELTVTDRSGIRLVYHHVGVGEVWLAGGQSNMELELRNAADGERAVNDSADPGLRFFNTPKCGHVSDELTRLENESVWVVCAPDTSGAMSAVAYWFAHRLRERLETHVPIGIIDCYVGGTSISCWMSETTLESSPSGRGYLERYHAIVDGKTERQMHEETDAWQRDFDAWNAAIAADQASQPDIDWETLNARHGECPWPPPMTTFSQYHPTGPFEAMICRVAPYALHGFLWYQGEEDERFADDYRAMLGMLVGEWRARWEGETLPFIIAQLPQWISKSDFDAGIDHRYWPVLREAQRDVSLAIADVYTVPLMDCGEFNNIHPTDKRTPGERLANAALNRIYGCADVPADVPEPVSWSYSSNENASDDDAGDANVHVSAGSVIVRFDHAEELRFSDKNASLEPPKHFESRESTPSFRPAGASGFEVSTDDGVWHPVAARITHSADDPGESFVTLPLPDTLHPTGIRYGWASWGVPPLSNRWDIPAFPFSHLIPHASSTTIR
ncbi:sialate O-acetylesterase [Bifidobacterium eulemuris]|nr:sialate O-acetylesterase [Bifidobacterium eulemuris]